MNRREFIRNMTMAGAAAGEAGCGGLASEFELEEATLATLQKSIESGKHTARSITEMYLKRIGALDKQGPALRSILETNPDALKIADELDAERKAKGPRGPLHGIPVLLKDNIETADRMTTTAGSLALSGSIPQRDSFLAEKLREAGAILLGKANMSEWANFRSLRSSSGWSARGGQCRNPYVLDRNPCGSSSGSGVAVSANLCALAIGTETDGSIVCPSTTNGIVGIKPTVGLVSRAGVIPVAHSQDTAGPMCRTVTDAAILLGAITGVDVRDVATAASREKSFRDYTQFLDPNALRGARIGVARNFFGFQADVDKLMTDAIATMTRMGAELVDPVDLANTDRVNPSELEVLLYEFKAGLNAYLANLGDKAPVKTLKQLIEFNEKNRDVEMPFFGQDLFLRAEEKGPLTDKAYVDALELNHRITRNEGIDLQMDKNKLDAIAAPAGGPAWITDLVNGDHFSGGSSTAAAVAGYPNITVPAGFVHELPVGISFFGRPWSEPKLIGIAYAYEQATRHRRPPKFLPELKLI